MSVLVSSQDNLVPVFEAEIDGVVQPVVNARDLHAFLKVGRDFTNWIKGRIRKFDFVENQDFMVFANSGENQSGGRPSMEYLTTLDMAKELSMVENNPQGKSARRYFIQCEKALRQQTNSLMMQFYGALAEFEKFSTLASQAGRTLNFVGKQLKPQAKCRLDAINDKLQPALGFAEFENEKAGHIRQDQPAFINPRPMSKGTDV